VIEEGIFGLADGNVHILDAGKVEGAEVEAGGPYADDGVSVAVHLDLLPDNVAGGTKPSSPEAFSQERDWSSAQAILVADEEAAQ
jgi:hypothetical protein